MTFEDIKKHTPCFIIDKTILNNNLNAFCTSLQKHWGNYILGYSCKTNSLPYILSHIQKCGGYAEVVSDTEYDLAEKTGYSPEHIIFNGPIKSHEKFFYSLENNSFVNLDSKRELVWLKEYSDLGKSAGVGIRVNFDLEAVCPEESLTDGGGNRFGYNVENGDFANVVKFISTLKGISIDGLHMHTNSKTRSLKVFEALSKQVCQLAREYNLNLKFIDIGGSFFVKRYDYQAYDNYAKAISSCLKEYFSPEQTILIVEPGSAVISTPIQYLTRVLDIKDTHRDRFVVTDGTRLHIDPFMRKTAYTHSLLASNPPFDKQIICGYTCMETDRIMAIDSAPELFEGDFIIYDNTGGYTMAFNAQFIEYYPHVFVKDLDDSYICVREKWNLLEYLQKSSY